MGLAVVINGDRVAAQGHGVVDRFENAAAVFRAVFQFVDEDLQRLIPVFAVDAGLAAVLDLESNSRG